MSQPTRTSTQPVTWVPADAVRVAGLVAVGVAALWFDGVAVALMLLVLGGLVVPRALGTAGRLDVAYGVGLLVAAWSAMVGLYESVAWWDVAIHFTVTGLVAAVAYDAMVHLDVVREPARARSRGHRAGIVLLVAALGLGLSVLWEVGEWLGHTYVDESIHVSEVDTLGDLVAGGVGSAVAGEVLLAARHRRPPGPDPASARARDHG